MPYVIVTTESGQEVDRFQVDGAWPGDINAHAPNTVWRNLHGSYQEPSGFLGRALRDALVVEDGGDPERLSERVMRQSARRS
jgi:hypothetical protein